MSPKSSPKPPSRNTPLSPHPPSSPSGFKPSPSFISRRLNDSSHSSDRTVSPHAGAHSPLQYNPSSSSIGSGASSSHSHRPTSSDTTSGVSSKRRIPIKRSIDAAYQRMCTLSENPKESPFGTLPAKFKLIYKSDVVVHFVNSVLLYMHAFVSRASEVKQMQQQLQMQQQNANVEMDHFTANASGSPNRHEPDSEHVPFAIASFDPGSPEQGGILNNNANDDSNGRASPNQMYHTFDATNPAEIKNAEEIVSALKKVSQGYSRILLQCSNFESSISDRSFFECFYYFVTTCVKFAMPKHEAWEDLEQELGRLFRGDEFRDIVNPKMNRSPSPDKGSPVHWSEIKFREEDILHVRTRAGAHTPEKTPKGKSPKGKLPKGKGKKKVIKPKSAKEIRLEEKKREEMKIKQINTERSVINAFSMGVGSNLLGLPKAKGNKGGAAEEKKKKESAAMTTHYQGLDKGASVEEHEERFELVANRIEHNLRASEQLRTYMQSPRRNKLLKSPRVVRPHRTFSDSQRALNLSPAIATILPHNSKSQSQQNDYKDLSLLTVHGFIGTVRTSPSKSPTTLPHTGMLSQS